MNNDMNDIVNGNGTECGIIYDVGNTILVYMYAYSY